MQHPVLRLLRGSAVLPEPVLPAQPRRLRPGSAALCQTVFRCVSPRLLPSCLPPASSARGRPAERGACRRTAPAATSLFFLLARPFTARCDWRCGRSVALLAPSVRLPPLFRWGNESGKVGVCFVDVLIDFLFPAPGWERTSAGLKLAEPRQHLQIPYRARRSDRPLLSSPPGTPTGGGGGERAEE